MEEKYYIAEFQIIDINGDLSDILNVEFAGFSQTDIIERITALFGKNVILISCCRKYDIWS